MAAVQSCELEREAVHDLIEALRGGYGIMLAAAALYQGACRSIRSYAVAWPRLCALAPLPYSLSGCRGGPSAPAHRIANTEYDRRAYINNLKHVTLCHQDASARLAPMPERCHTTKHRAAARGSQTCRSTRPHDRVDEEVEAAARIA